jgi:Fic family protein
MARLYETSHQWLTFTFDSHRFSPLSMRLGEAFSKCQHLAGTPLLPAVASELATIYLAKGVNSTTAIEGNTLTEGEVAEVLAARKTLLPSQAYLQREVENVAATLSQIDQSAVGDHSPFRITAEWLRDINRALLDGIEAADHVVPGEFTTRPLVVGSYRGAPPEDVPYLVDRLCTWLNTYLDQVSDSTLGADLRFVHAFYAAVLGHLYIAWIHPFGDGNGRTARALECAVLAHSGIVPWISSSLLSDHYNRTRSMYYRRLDAASHTPTGVEDFVAYAAAGFVDQLREQIDRVQAMQRNLAWRSYVDEVLQSEPAGQANRRRRALVLALPPGAATPKNRLRRLSPEVAELYADKSDKTVARDLNRLAQLKLVVAVEGGYGPNLGLMDAFVPATRPAGA